MDIKKIKNIPTSPGVYLMKDKNSNVIYIGKAASLKKRVLSYFQSSRNNSLRVDKFISKVKGIAYIPTQSEAEALLFEASLVKEYQPRYNIALKDDKSYPLLKLTVNDDFPRLILTRQIKRNGAKYFGPYADVKLLRQALKAIRKTFPLRTCRIFPKSVCLNYHIKQCLGPCVGGISKTSYKDIVRQLITFLKGRRAQLLKDLYKTMVQASSNKKFEEAAYLRDRIKALSSVVSPSGNKDRKKELSELKKYLGLKKIPRRIEAFDISNIGASHAVGSMILFYNGIADKSGYRKYRIKTVEGVDDYAMLKEIIKRRYTKEKLPHPDLILIDGGRGHLSSAQFSLGEVGLKNIPVISIAKRKETIFTPNRKMPLNLAKNSSVSKLIQRIRDEAHRFAISYHKILRSKVLSVSSLDKVKNIGPKRKKDLIKHFNNIENIKKASIDELLKVKGISVKAANEIVSHFK